MTESFSTTFGLDCGLTYVDTKVHCMNILGIFMRSTYEVPYMNMTFDSVSNVAAMNVWAVSKTNASEMILLP